LNSDKDTNLLGDFSFITDTLKEKLLCSKTLDRVRFEISRDGYSVPILDDNCLNSKYSVSNEIAKSDPYSEVELIIAVGFGMGYHLHNRVRLCKKTFVVPIDVALLKSVILNNSDQMKMLDKTSLNGRTSLTVGTIDDLAQSPYLIGATTYRIVTHPVLERLYPAKTLELIKMIKHIVNPVIMDNKTIRSLNKIWEASVRKNLIDVKKGRFDQSKIEICNDKIVLVTGGGPSLEDNIAEISSSRERLFIAATDTSAKILLRNNIIPDLIFSLDAQYYSNLPFLGLRYNGRVLFDITARVRLMSSRRTPLISDHPICAELESHGMKTPVFSGYSRNVGGSIISFFKRYFPQNPIVTAGIDFGYKNYRVYSNNGYITDECIVRGNYFDTSELIYTKLLYRRRHSNTVESWSSDSLLTDYAANTTSEDVYTLSDSPFVRFTRIDSFDQVPIESDSKITSYKIKL